MRVTASAPAPPVPPHVIEEICIIELELQTVHIQIEKLKAKEKWLELLRQNFLRRFRDSC